MKKYSILVLVSIISAWQGLAADWFPKEISGTYSGYMLFSEDEGPRNAGAEVIITIEDNRAEFRFSEKNVHKSNCFVKRLEMSKTDFREVSVEDYLGAQRLVIHVFSDGKGTHRITKNPPENAFAVFTMQLKLRDNELIGACLNYTMRDGGNQRYPFSDLKKLAPKEGIVLSWDDF